jgi:hypothetical protein
MSSSTLESGPALVVEEGSQQQQNVQPQRMVDTTSLGSASDGIPFSKSLIEQEEETFYSAKDNQFGDDNLWGLLSGVGGNIYEW